MSKKRDKGITLSDKLSSLIQAKPTIVESEDEDLTTVEKLAVSENESDFSADELEVTTFRKRNNKLLDEDDSKYSGKGVSRKDLTDFEENLGSEASEQENSQSESSVEDEQSEENDEEIPSEDEEEIPSEDEGEIPSDDEEEIQSENELNLGENHSPKKTKKQKRSNENFTEKIISSAVSDIEKGKGIKNQLHIWDFLLDCRMKFQKSLIASNQFPTFKNFERFKNEGGLEFQNSLSQCRSSLRHLLNSLLSLQKVLLESNHEFYSEIGNTEASAIKDDSEEIESSSDNENNLSCGENKTLNTVGFTHKKLKKLEDFSSEISNRHKKFEKYRNNTIQKWNDKTRIGYVSNKNFSAFEQSTLKQIEHVLLDKQRLIKRTQVKRSMYHILGENEEEPLPKTPKLAGDETKLNGNDAKNKAVQKEIFDDDDFYHQLLSELVKSKANNVTDPVQLGRQWMQLQKIRSKIKKTVDVKASKGRKVRFVVHPKLVNFMMPINDAVYNKESKTELFNSLFGNNKK